MDSVSKTNTKNIMAMLFSFFYALMIVLNFDFKLTLFYNFRYAINTLLLDVLPLLLPVSMMVLMASQAKEFALKKWLLPIAFGITLAKNLVVFTLSALNTFSVFGIEISVLLIFLLIFSGLMLIAFATMFLGTLPKFSHTALLKCGALGYLILFAVGLVIDFINAGGLTYIKSIPAEYWPITVKSFINTLSQILFYIGVFLFATNQKCEDTAIDNL